MNFYQRLFIYFINIIDNSNKKKIINFFIKKFKKKKITLLDIGAHRGETIDLFSKYLNLDRVYSIEPNADLYKELVRNKKYNNSKFNFYNIGLGNKSELKKLKVLKDTSSSTFNELNKNSLYFLRKKKILNFFNKDSDLIDKEQEIEIIKTNEFLYSQNIKKIDIFKIDTEGFEYNILLGLNKENFKNIEYIYLEHHFDLMIEKKYKYTDLRKLLELNGFKLEFKLKMKFRKTFEYIFRNINF